MTKVLYFDIDGVLARFTDGACRIHGRLVQQPTVWNFHKEQWSPTMTSAELFAPMGRAFWAGLDLWDDGMRLLQLTEWKMHPHHKRIGLLTSPCETDGCIDGKRDWIGKHLPEYKFRLIPTPAKGELFAHPNAILVDDSDDNIASWREHGGVGVLVPRPWNARRDRTFPDGTFHVGDLQDEIREALK